MVGSIQVKVLMKWFLAFLLGLGMISNSWGTHIVGGEFELIHINDFNYRLNLIQYFDVVNGNPGAEDSVVVVFMFRKSDNQFMRSVSLPKAERELVSYTQPECAIGSLITRRLVYSTDIYLDPLIFNDPEGYYVV